VKHLAVISPLLISILPGLLILTTNIQQVSSTSILKLCLVNIVLAAALYQSLAAWTRSPHTAAVAASCFIAAWGFYGWMRLASIPVFAFGLFVIIWKHDLAKLTPWLIVATLIPAWICLSIDSRVTMPSMTRDLVPRHMTASVQDRDIYFIIMDSYAGSSTLRSRFGMDNTEFLRALEGIGFQTGECRSTSTVTLDSVSYMLNGNIPYDRMNAIRHNDLMDRLEAQGYETSAFATGFAWSEIVEAHHYYTPPYWYAPTELEAMLLLQTPLRFLPIDIQAVWGYRYRYRTSNLLEHLPDASMDPGAQFVFAHIIQPHPPFVFLADGSPASPRGTVNPLWLEDNSAPEYNVADYNRGYMEQLSYISAAILPVLSDIVSNAPDSIIIITGDHGPWYASADQDALSVLCATYGTLAIDARLAVLEVEEQLP
jgi:hypothetical protein